MAESQPFTEEDVERWASSLKIWPHQVRALLSVLVEEGRLRPAQPKVDADPRRLPTKRPGWLGEWQTWPCGRCGREVDDVVPHDCAEPVLDVQAGTDSAPPSDQDLIEGNTP